MAGGATATALGALLTLRSQARSPLHSCVNQRQCSPDSSTLANCEPSRRHLKVEVGYRTWAPLPNNKTGDQSCRSSARLRRRPRPSGSSSRESRYFGICMQTQQKRPSSGTRRENQTTNLSKVLSRHDKDDKCIALLSEQTTSLFQFYLGSDLQFLVILVVRTYSAFSLRFKSCAALNLQQHRSCCEYLRGNMHVELANAEVRWPNVHVHEMLYNEPLLAICMLSTS